MRAGSWAPPFIAAVKVSGGELCQQSPRVTAPPAWPQDTKGKFPFISTSSAPGLFLPPIVKGSQRRRETLTPLRDWEVEIQTDRGRGKAGGDLEDRGAGGEKPSLRESGVPRNMSTRSEMKSKETQRAGTTGCTLGLFGPTFSVHPEN